MLILLSLLTLKFNKVVFIVNFEHISNLFLEFHIADCEQVNVCWVDGYVIYILQSLPHPTHRSHYNISLTHTTVRT